MQYFRPELVDHEAIVDDAPEQLLPYDVLPVPDCQIPSSGVYHNATRASQGKGELLAGALIDGLCQIIEREFDA
jgi:creatinine amidohydrolase/Fe(II)-dependent formamide hydrolase-like protein